MYKLLAMDLDETLFNDNHQIDDKNRELIAKAKAHGVKIVPCSGRGPGFLGSLYDDLDLNVDGEYSILGNGAIVIENKSNRIIKHFAIPFQKAKELFHFGLNQQLCVQIFTPTNVYMYNIDKREQERVVAFGDNIVFMDNYDMDFLEDDIILKLLYMKEDGTEYFKDLATKMGHITKDHITVSFSSNRYLELNALGIHKGIGLMELASYLDIDISETIGVGDNYNDFGLLKCSGLSIAVQNAVEDIKGIVDVVTKATNNENAIAEVIETYIFKEDE